MSESLQHECGIAMIRLLKPPAYYLEKHDTPLYALNKLYLMMEKQRNRGQDGAGIAAVKLDMPPGHPYIFSARSIKKDPIAAVYEAAARSFHEVERDDPAAYREPHALKMRADFAAEILLGHLRYGTRGQNSKIYCHPFIRRSNWMSRNLVVAGNFNLTNIRELFDRLVGFGQHPIDDTDTNVVLEKIGHFLEEENKRLAETLGGDGVDNQELSRRIAERLDIPDVLRRSTKYFDGGYVMAGIVGSGDMFVLRDPCGIRPAFYYRDEDMVVVASERPAIQTAFGLPHESIREIKPGHALIVRRGGAVTEDCIAEGVASPCSFERIYFSRGVDAEIYRERKRLGRALTGAVMDAIDGDVEHTVFSYIPNTSEVAFLGLMEGLEEHLDRRRAKLLQSLEAPTEEDLYRILALKPRVEKIMNKDVKLRTFIANDRDRRGMVNQAYDTTYGVVRRGVDTLVMVDDSIVRGTTLRMSILKILDRLGPKRIVVASSAPQIRYPDCYGIDMSKIKDFVAFEAAVELIREAGREHLLDEIYEACREENRKPLAQIKNRVRAIYDDFTPEQISDKIADILRPDDLQAEFVVVYQSIENLHAACPDHGGDWYFTGRYPTPGGNRVANQSFLYYMERSDQRAY